MPEVLHEQRVAVPMRDGVVLYADLWRPDVSGPVPVLVTRTPYNRALVRPSPLYPRLAAQGFAVLNQDCRGRFDSEGTWQPNAADAEDGYDTVEWAAAQPWSTGKIGMFGGSYGGQVQWQAAILRPPSLVTILPECSPLEFWQPHWGPGGAFNPLGTIGWVLFMALDEAARVGLTDDPLIEEMKQIQGSDADDLVARGAAAMALAARLITHRPSRRIPFFDAVVPWYEAYFDHERRDHPHWLALNPKSHLTEIDLPMVHIGGWYDSHSSGTLDGFVGMSTLAPSERARSAQHLIMGPWTHWSPTAAVVGDVDFGPDAALDTAPLYLEWFGHWLRGGPAPVDLPPVRIFVMGTNVWRDEQEWPLARTTWTPFHLHANGRLTDERPQASEPDRFTFDPRDPVLTVGGRLGAVGAGPLEQGPLDTRTDVLAYTSDPLGEPLEITGPVLAELWVSTSAPDTDFSAKLLDVHPDGTSYNLVEGIVRTRAVLPIPLDPGAVYRVPIELGATSIVIGEGHRVQVLVSSSSWPQWEPNPNSGKPSGTDTDDDLRTADQTVFHDPAHPSRIILPVIPSPTG